MARYKKNNFDNYFFNFNKYIDLEKKILDYIDYIDDENTQLPNIVKQHYIYQFRDLHYVLSIDNHEDLNAKYKSLSNKFVKALTEEKNKISTMINEVESDINTLNNILGNNNQDLHGDFISKIEKLRHEALEIKTSIADSKYILSKFYIIKNKIKRIKNKYELLDVRSHLFNNVKNDTVNMLSSYKNNISDNPQIQVMINKVKSQSTNIHHNRFDKSYKICEDSKKSLFNNITQ